MQAIYEYTGIVEAVCDLQTFPSGFTKQDLVLTDDNDVQTKYPNHIAFTFKKDNTAKLNNVQKGQRAKVRFAIDGRVWPSFVFSVKFSPRQRKKPAAALANFLAGVYIREYITPVLY